MGKIKKIIHLTLAFFLGMITVAHWNDARRYIRNISPFVDDSFSSTAKELFEQGKRDIKKESLKALDRTKDYIENK
ncbi:MAG: hypothetical protein H6622_15110 [Halobacteriovoraceae bacterium]|nr:hypothetical protein [Halobacteriovoraceae bacterium]